METGRSIPELTRDVAFHLGDMFRNELKLARVEAADSVKSLSGGVTTAAAGIAICAAAATLGLLALAYGLATVMPLWAATLAAAVIGGGLGLVLFFIGRSAMKPKSLTLPKTREQVSRGLRNISEQVH
jgi:hypothetical protein